MQTLEEKEILYMDTFDYYEMAKESYVEMLVEDGYTKEEAENDFDRLPYVETDIFFELERENVIYLLESLMERYEKRYGCSGTFYQCGSVGVWNGTFVGGKKINNYEDVFSVDCDDIRVYAESDGTLTFSYHHHDGSHYMNLYILSDSVEEKRFGYYADELEVVQWLVENRKPLKVKK